MRLKSVHACLGVFEVFDGKNNLTKSRFKRKVYNTNEKIAAIKKKNQNICYVKKKIVPTRTHTMMCGVYLPQLPKPIVQPKCSSSNKYDDVFLWGKKKYSHTPFVVRSLSFSLPTRFLTLCTHL